jgi:hypothetical protein
VPLDARPRAPVLRRRDPRVPRARVRFEELRGGRDLVLAGDEVREHGACVAARDVLW